MQGSPPISFIMFSEEGAAVIIWEELFVEAIDDLFDSFNGETRAGLEKSLRLPLSDNSPHIDYQTKASMEINS
jgi:hypothetical protein